jgi:acyl-CoA reductase-like NAD-dependent aldehyde dehydrogenase
MNTAVLERTASPLPTDEHYARNLIGGQWQFPAAPYEFEIRNPADSTISAVVPLSSRFDVAAAYRAATVAAAGWWAVPAERMPRLHSLLGQLTRAGDDLAQLQAVETGLSLQDSRAVLSATLDMARTLLSCGAVVSTGHRTGGVSGHILSWGAPFTEILTSVLPALIRGDTVIVKPSLRGPLTPVAFGLLATDTGLPPGVVNIVQGTGGDIGADLIGRRELSALYVRGSERTIAQAERGHARAHVPLHVLRGGGNVFIVGPDVSADLETLVEAITNAVRMNSAGGPFGLPLLAVHADQAEELLQAVLLRLSDTVAAPLPTEPLRRRAVQRIDSLLGIGASAVLGGLGFPDDISHRMSWRLPPTVLLLGEPDSPAARFDQASVPLGPVLSVVTWNNSEQLRTLFTAPRARDGVASLWGVGDGLGSGLPHGRVIAGPDSPFLPLATTLAPTWTGGAR